MVKQAYHYKPIYLLFNVQQLLHIRKYPPPNWIGDAHKF